MGPAYTNFMEYTCDVCIDLISNLQVICGNPIRGSLERHLRWGQNKVVKIPHLLKFILRIVRHRLHCIKHQTSVLKVFAKELRFLIEHFNLP